MLDRDYFVQLSKGKKIHEIVNAIEALGFELVVHRGLPGNFEMFLESIGANVLIINKSYFVYQGEKLLTLFQKHFMYKTFFDVGYAQKIAKENNIRRVGDFTFFQFYGIM